MDTHYVIRGRVFHTKLEVPLAWREGTELAAPATDRAARFGIGLLRAGSAVLSFARESVPVVAPAIILLDDRTRPTIRQAHALRLDTLYFHPAYINSSFSIDTLHVPYPRHQWSGSTKQDYFLLENFLAKEDAKRVYSLAPHVAAQIGPQFDATTNQAAQQPDKFWPCRTRSYLIELLFQLRLLQAEPVAGQVALPEMEDPRGRRIGRALQYIQESFQRDLTLSELARECATNRTTLNAEFRALTGMTVRAYTIALRMKMAAALLRDTRIPVSEVMERVGYGNQSHFTRAFRQTVGDAPGAYREKNCIV